MREFGQFSQNVQLDAAVAACCSSVKPPQIVPDSDKANAEVLQTDHDRQWRQVTVTWCLGRRSLHVSCLHVVALPLQLARVWEVCHLQ